ncbi:hypothetical protein CONPUDRAFT_151972 [Coniophora puteana RWD-64-598 SS2]|uniref:HECT-type E3 ubiquitin transferase n=1 Tax=Coniophora puteana (strain RWD-64-598) TaxID=741705 RepID=A0A5M3MWD9_CONPW|nr:uncharacterized protein CONPUDRAFT_151972 [Coniophora puteana RWD-64-598 SS2]EIW82911.1 hypothetical protein CONPUDRAFT_151972 [Coniophora puteana RWD-64-598 SS2]
MKISQKSKKPTAPHPQVAELISKLLNTPNDDLADALAEIDVWKWPRSDLNAWTKVLDKFDEILEEVIRDWDLQKLQVNVFTPLTKSLICEILKFERLLLENSTNRKTFNSYDRLNDLLFTSDLDVLILALNLLLRPSQQYSAQPAVSHALNISTPRLQSLAKRWSGLREYGVTLFDLARPNNTAQLDVLPADAREVNFVYYKTGAPSKDANEAKAESTDVFDAPPTTPRKPSSVPSGSSTGAVTIHVDERIIREKEVTEIVADVLEAHTLSSDDKFELICRTRCAQALFPENNLMREKLIIVRLLAIAIYGHTHNESQASSALFLYEPDLPMHVAELLQLDQNISVPIQTSAVAAVDALARYRGKVQEVLTAVNAGVAHGTLMALLRNTIVETSNPESKLPHSFVDALLSFVTFLASHGAGGNMVVGAGLIPLLVQVIENRLVQRLPMVSKAMQLVDNVLYGFANAFQLFANARGVDVLVGRIQHEVDFDINMYGNEIKSREVFGSYGELPVARAAVLKHTLRSLHRMMQSSGTSEGLRGLIDSSVLASVKKVVQYRGLFGPSVLPIAINIMATFVHNEPTCLPTIQEAGLPLVFYKAIEDGIEPVIEVVQSIPNAIGALCLNQAGQDQLAARPSIIPGILSIYTSERHLKMLKDKENAAMVGTAIDELIRHHPSLKTAVFESIKATMTKIETLGEAYEVPENMKEWYGLCHTEKAAPMEDVVTTGDVGIAPATGGPTTGDEVSAEESAPSKDHDNIIISFFDVFCRFLEGFFQHSSHCKDFIRQADGLERIGRMTALPCLPYDFANSIASDSLIQVLRLMVEVGPNEALFYFSKLLATSLAETQPFWGSLGPDSKLARWLEVSEDHISEGNYQFRSLVILHIRTTLVADIFLAPGYTHGRGAMGLLQTLMSDPPKLVTDLGALHRACVWENILLKDTLSSQGISTGSNSHSLGGSPTQDILGLPDAEHTAPATNGIRSDSNDSPEDSGSSSKRSTPREKNAKALKHLTHGLPSILSPFFQSIAKMFYARRNPDPVQKKQILNASSVVANIMVEHLRQEVPGNNIQRYDYYSVMLGLVTILLVDERTVQSTLHTALLFSFHKIGGVDMTLDVAGKFTDVIDQVTRTDAQEHGEVAQQELTRAQGGLKVALHLIHPLISAQPLFESGQTLLVMTREKKETDADYFESHHFLVQLRLACAPFLQRVWEAPWILSCPLPLVKTTVQAILELTSAENEEVKGDVASSGATGTLMNAGGLPIRPPAGPDENRIRQLTDMGFPRSAAERALVRTHNNVNAATELLLAHPFPIPPDPETEQTDTPAEETAQQASDASPETPAETIDTGPAAASTSNEDPMDSEGADRPSEPSPQGKSLEVWRNELQAARAPILDGLCQRSLQLVDNFPSLIFDVYHTFLQATGERQTKAMKELAEDIGFHTTSHDGKEEALAVRCRVLALVLSESPSLADPLAEDLMTKLILLLESYPVDAEQPNVPKWLAAHLLVTEMLLSVGQQPSNVAVPSEGEPINASEILAGPLYPEARPTIFSYCLRLLAVPDLPRDELLSTLRILVVVTQDHDTASQLVEQDVISSLFSRLRGSCTTGSQSYVAIILRHIAEDPGTVRSIMTQEIKRFFSQPRTHVIDVHGFLRHCSSLALRDPTIFVQATRSLCQLQQPHSSTHHIMLKPEVAKENEKASASVSAKASDGMALDPPATIALSTQPSTEMLESLVHFVINELIKSLKSAPESILAGTEPPKAQANSTTPVPTSTRETHPSPDATSNISSEQDAYSCFLMQCLTELLFSYDACKAAFLSFSPKKRQQTSAKESGKPRTAALQFLLSELITFGAVDPSAESSNKGKATLCGWAMSVIVALCIDTSLGADSKELSNELVSIRKFVLDSINRAIKELPSSESLDARYGRLLALSDLCSRLLTVRFSAHDRKPMDENSTHVAKIMLEKNFVATLTNALAEVDLNYPHVRSLVAAILKPLENLTRIAIKMSRASEKSKELHAEKNESEGSITEEEEDEDDIEDSDREEMPDLYRNSALGMYGGEMDDGAYSPDDEMDEDEDVDEEDVEMDFEDETGSDATSESEDIEDEGDPETMEDEAHGSEDWHDEDEFDEDEADDLIENNEEEVVEDVAEGEVDPDGEMMWQDEDDGGDGDEPEGEEDGIEPIAVVHADREEEQDILSDEEDYDAEMGVIDVRDTGVPDAENMFTFVEQFPGDSVQGHLRDQPFFSRRFRPAAPDDVQIFGRPRPGGPPASENTVHPLLMDASSAPLRSSANLSRGGRRPRAAGAHDELIQTIEEIMGDGAGHLFQHLISRAGVNPEVLRVDVGAGNMANLERSVLQRRGGGLFSNAVRAERPQRQGDSKSESGGFDPLLTVQRWAEESKIIHGNHVAERAGKLANHIIIALLPAALQAQKEREERQQAQRKAEEEEDRKVEEADAQKPESRRVEEEQEVAPEQTHEASTDAPPDSSSPQTPLQLDVPSESQPADPISSTDVEMADVQTQNAASPVPASSAEQAPSEADRSSDQLQEAESGPSQSEAVERVTVMVHGSSVDITDMGIDPTFLEALPDDIREEVINQHVRDQRAAAVERPSESQISPEFLDALPPDIRAELIQQERMEQARRAPAEADTGNPPDTGEEMDPASFIASLEPPLRQVVLLDSDDGFIQTLPSYMIAEAGAYREEANGPRRQYTVRTAPGRGDAPRASSSKKPPPPRDAIQLLDKSGVATLVRLLFFPQVTKKNILFKVLVNICENSKTRAELFNLLLSVLQSGPGDLAAVDRSFAQMTTRTAKSPLQTPKAAGKQKAPEFLATMGAGSRSEDVPDLVAQRSVEALTYIVNANELSSLFFLTEHELPYALRKTTKKGKGKEKQLPQTHYPIVLLLGLLDRQSLLKTTTTMDSVVTLLSTVTKPLVGLKDVKKDIEPPASVPVPASNLENTPATTATPMESSMPSQEQSARTDTVGGNAASTTDDKVVLQNPPQIPHSVLRLIVNILTIGECSSRTFQQSLTLISNLSYIPDGRDVIAQELKVKAQECGHNIFLDLNELMASLKTPEDVLASSITSKFSSPSSDQAKLLRVLKTIDYMYTPRVLSQDDVRSSEDAEKAQSIYESFNFTTLWRRLGDCLAAIEERPEIEHIATVLLPLIESLMVVCKHVGSKPISGSNARTIRPPATPMSPTTPKETMEDLFVSFTDAHRKILNSMVRTTPSLMSGSFSLLVQNPRILDFDNKRNYFTQQVHRRPRSREHHSTLQLNVRRARVFEDSFQQFHSKDGERIKHAKLNVRFYDEEGVDAGGVTREWFQILARQMFDPNNALFQPCAADRLTYQPNKNSWVNPEHLSFFKFVGRVIGKAIYDGRLLDAYFAKSIYRQLLGKPVDYRDVEWVDPEYYNSLCWILENDPTPLELTFSFGRNRIFPLKEGGEQISVTNENKREFVQLSASFRLYSSIKEQIEHLVSGFHDIIPKDLVNIFNEKELELLISGTPDIDVDEWRAATEYNGYTSSDPVIVWWWRALKSFNREERAKVLSFATGTSRVPLGGFVDLQGVQGVQRFSIHRAYGDPDRLPQAHTCFNQIDLPQYSSYEMLRQQLMLAISEGGEGFGFA